MLVLTRKNHESVMVGDTSRPDHVLKVTVLEVRGGTVRFGFEARADIPIHRWEVWQRIIGRQPACGGGPQGIGRPLRRETAIR
jgi:carbon storage regulator CsrA